MSDSFHRDNELFAEALRQPPGERAAWLVRVCGNDDALRRRVEELLQVHERVGDFMEDPAWVGEAGDLATAADDGARHRVGRYRLIEKLGEGGCGVVYLAEQDEPIKRQVALKIIKPGMDTRQVIARFEAERQALALMDHPGIAKVFDAGETESGRPYFVMELIRGTRITDYCDRNALTTAARLELFVQVCQAIQHAHQKGIIHRDIKPSNILVTTTAEGTAQPVVIDFGIAKATVDTRLTDKTLFTAVDMLIGTPTYMSPEQTAISSADVDTRSDIYSLGVLLYELLTGTTPFDAGELLQLGIDEVRRAIREQEPLRPSARLSRMTSEDLTTVARKRRSEPPTLIRAVRGDLDWIAMKALEKNRARRYGTASDLARDVGRFLANETVAARPASAWYRFRKIVARNRAVFASLVIILAILLGGLVAVSLALQRERAARVEADAARRHAEAAGKQAEAARKQAETEKLTAQSEAAKNAQVTRFMQDILQGVGPSFAQGRDTTVLQEVVNKTMARLETELGDQPAVQAELQLGIGRVYVEAHQWEPGLALYRQAEANYRKGTGPESAGVAKALHNIGFVYLATGKIPEAETAYREALAIRRKLSGPDSREVALSLNDLARLQYYYGSDKAAAEQTFRDVLAIRRRVLPPDHIEITDSLYILSLVADKAEDRLAEAEALQREVLERWRKANGPRGLNLDVGTFTVGRTLRREAKFSQAEATFLESVEIARAMYGEAHAGIVAPLVGLGYVQFAQGRLADVVTSQQQALAQRAKVEGTHMQGLIPDAIGLIALAAEAAGRMDEAEAKGREALEVARKLTGGESVFTAAALARLGHVLVSAGKADEAESLYAGVLSEAFVAKPASGDFLRGRANYLARRGRWGEALADAERAAKHLPNDFESRHFAAVLRLADGRTDDYRASCQALAQRYGGTKTAVVACRLALTALVSPASGVSAETAQAWAEAGVTGGMEGMWADYANATKALADYRHGRVADAIARARQAQRSARADLRVIALVTEALAQFRQGEAASAHATFEKARIVARDRLAATGSGDFGADWWDGGGGDFGADWKGWIHARTLLAEAEAALGAPAVTNGGASP